MNPAQVRWWAELGLQMEGVPWPVIGASGPVAAAAAPEPAPREARVRQPAQALPAEHVHEADPQVRATRIAGLTLPGLRSQIAACTACALHAGRTNSVPGLHAAGARWLFVGESPAAEDDLSGQPFSGAGGALLDAMLTALGLQRGLDASLVTLVRCRTPVGREPTPTECQACLPFLQREVALLAPRVVVTLGKAASQQLLGSDYNLGSLRGKVHRHQGIAVVATYAPDYLLRNPAEKARVWADLCLARRQLAADQT